jgi:AcrR family transcriptional regulator
MTAAMAVFARHGYRGAALAAVADAADLTQPGLLHHFPSKEHLLTAVLEERDQADIRRLRELGEISGLEFLEALRRLVEHNATQRDLVQLFIVLAGEGVSPEHPAHGYFVERYERIRESIRGRIEGSQAAGEFRSDVDARSVAALLMAVMDGLQIQWLLDDGADMTETFGLFLDFLTTRLTTAP